LLTLPRPQYEHVLKSCLILIIDDELDKAQSLEATLQRAGYVRCISTCDPRRVLSLWNRFEPDLVILDLDMRQFGASVVLQQLKSRIPSDSYFPILVLTAEASIERMRVAFSRGATDFLSNSLGEGELVLYVKKLLEMRLQYVRLEKEKRAMQMRVWEQAKQLRDSQADFLTRLALVAEFRDDNTAEHTQRVGQLSAAIGRECGLPAHDVELLRQAAPLHDVGKIGIPDRILLKPGRLDAEELRCVRTHTTIGARILSGSRSPVLQLAEEIALYHHEWWDGGGYVGLREESIPVEARIVSIADVFDVITHERPYKKGWPIERARAEIELQSNKQFDPRLVRAFVKIGSSL